MEEDRLTNRLQQSAAAARQNKGNHDNNNNIEKIAVVEEDPNFDRKLDLITAGARPFVREHLLTKITRENCQTLINYILAMQTEVSPAQSYREGIINRLKRFAEFHNPKSFRDITRQDVIDFLDSLVKPESVDPLHQWKGTHEVNRITLIRFFRWLYHPDIAPHKRPKPAVMENIPKLDRKEESIYKPTDRWTEEEDAIFYKYCPSARDRCLHAIARDTGCRREEMVNMNIKDVVVQRLENGHQIAKITVNGKTGVRSVRLNNSYPRLKDWLSNGHPFPGFLNAPIFCGVGKKNTGRRLSLNTINSIYERYQKVWFPKLLKDPLVLEEDKRVINDMLKKKWNPHNRRHTAATEIAKAIKDPMLIDDYFGWSHKGNTRLKYMHYFSEDSIDAVLTVMDGLPLTSEQMIAQGKQKSLLKPKQCLNCNESNKPEAKFCSKCKYALSFEAYNETIEESEKTKKELEALKIEREKDKKALEELLESNQKQIQDRIEQMEEMQEKIFEELLRKKEPELKKIESKEKREHEETMLMLEAGKLAGIDEEEGEKEDDFDAY